MSQSSEIIQGLRHLRVRQGWTQEELAERAGVSSSTIIAAEGGKPVNVRTLGKVADAFGISVSALLDARPKPRVERDTRRVYHGKGRGKA